MKYHIFISYSHEHRDIMRSIRSYMQDFGFSTWADEDIPKSAADFHVEIEQAIHESACFVVLLSPEAKTSAYVLRELSLALELNKKIFPVLIDGDHGDSIPQQIEKAQVSDIRNHKIFIPEARLLCEGIHKDVFPEYPRPSRNDVILIPTGTYDGLNMMLPDLELIDNLDIFCHTSYAHQFIYQARSIHVKQLRLLLRGGEVSPKIDKEIQDQKIAWELYKGKTIDEISIKLYSIYHRPMHHFSIATIANSSRLHFGPYIPTMDQIEVRSMRSYIVRNISPESQQMIQDFVKLFNTIWDEFSDPCPDK